MKNKEERRFAAAMKDLRGGDLLLYRAAWRPWHCLAGRTIYSHAAMLARGHEWPNQWQVLEMRARGGRVSLLAAEVDRWPGRIDLFQANPGRRWATFDRRHAVAMMRGFSRKRYSRFNLFRAVCLHLPIVRLLGSAEFVQRAWYKWLLGNAKRAEHAWDLWPLTSSSAVSVAYGNGGVDPVPLVHDRRAQPGDLARSSFFEYRFTLVP